MEVQRALVVADHAFFLNAQDLHQIRHGYHNEGAALLRDLDREPCVVRRYINGMQPGVGFSHRRDTASFGCVKVITAPIA